MAPPAQIRVTALASRKRSSDAETHDGIAVVGRIAFSGGRAQQPRRKHPRATAINSEAIALAVLRLGVARRGLVRAPVGGHAGVAVVVTVFGPLPNVAGHVVKAECVRRLRAHRMRLAARAEKPLTSCDTGVGSEPSVAGRAVRIIAPPEFGRGAGACGVLPFGFAGQAVRARMTGFLIQPCDIGFRILPTDAHYWIAIDLLKPGIFPSRLRIFLIFGNGAA